MATPEARQLVRQFPALALGYSGELCGQVPPNLLASLLVGQHKREIAELAGEHMVALSPPLKYPYSVEIIGPVFVDAHTTLPECLALKKRASGMPAGVFIDGPYAGLIFSIASSFMQMASHFWNETTMRKSYPHASTPFSPRGGVIFTSEPHSVEFHLEYCAHLQGWFDELERTYPTTSAAFLGLIEQAGIPRPGIFNKVIQGQIY